MIGSSMLKRLAVTAAVAVAGFAGATTAAQASPTWTTTGDFEGYGTLSVGGSLATFTCDVTISGNAANVAGVAKATISDFTTGGCYSPDPRCSVGLEPNSPSSWTMTVSGSAAPFRVSLGSVSFTLEYQGATCPLNGVNFPVSGTVGSTFVHENSEDGAWLEFDNESGLSTLFGSAPVNGFLTLAPTAGGELGLS